MSDLQKRLDVYFRDTPRFLVLLDFAKIIFAVIAYFVATPIVQSIATSDGFQAGLHRRMLGGHPDFQMSAFFYGVMIRWGAALSVYWTISSIRNFLKITNKRMQPSGTKAQTTQGQLELPPWPYKREAFALTLGELQDRDGSRVPSTKNPDLKPRWLVLQERALYTGFFITGGIGSGKTASVAYPCLDQILGFQRPIKVVRNGKESTEQWRFSGLVMDEKGDFCANTQELARKWNRERDFIRIAPGGDWLWNPIFNPAIPTWAVGFQLGQILRRVAKGQQGSDPFWENAPRELVMDFLVLLDWSQSYYTITDYLKVLISQSNQEEHYQQALARFQNDYAKLDELDRLWKRITSRNKEMGAQLLGSLTACAKSGLALFEWPEVYKTFCPTRDDYFMPAAWDEDIQDYILKPRPNVFAGFDGILEQGTLIGLDMPKAVYFDAANFIQVALKAAWQDAVMRRDTRGADGKLLIPARFGEKIGYAPTFMMSDECQENVVPQDQNFLAQCRSKRASCWWITQSHSSIEAAFGTGKDADVASFVQNNMTRIFLRQSDLKSMETIEKDVGLKDVAKTQVSITEGGQQSDLSYAFGKVVNQGGLSVSETKTVTVEEKPFFEKEELRRLPDFVAIVLPSNGEVTLPATMCFLRPTFIFKSNPKLSKEISWHDWPDKLRRRITLENLPQEVHWGGWDTDKVDLDHLGSAKLFDGGFLGVKVRASHADVDRLAPEGESPWPGTDEDAVHDHRERAANLEFHDEPVFAQPHEGDADDHQGGSGNQGGGGFGLAERLEAEKHLRAWTEGEAPAAAPVPTPKPAHRPNSDV
jgi:TraM recognition site of TraD and TraG